MKKICISLVLVLLFILPPVLTGCFPRQSVDMQSLKNALDQVTEQMKNSSGDYVYMVDTDGAAVITGYNGHETDLVIPAEIDGIRVKELGAKSFYGNTELLSVSVPEGVEWINSNAFTGCVNIGSYSFPSTLKVIASYAFSLNRSLTGVTLPENMRSVNSGAFYSCSKLARLEITGKDTKFSGNPLTGCHSLSEVVIDPGNEHLKLENSAITDRTENIFICYLPGHGVGVGGRKTDIEYSVPDGIEVIDYGAFENCDGITSVRLPDSLKTIKDNAFLGCTNLKNINIPSQVESIGTFAFEFDKQLSELTIPEATKIIGRHAFDGCDSLVVSVYEGSYAEEYVSGYSGGLEFRVIPRQ
ncbi:MAG: leucine-rich repeat domain-containing protein [Clostridia bacterium]|nr:leucine-rich repeat domain-containing protein [Clostridia bacterium]